jgi:hypothetical protein
VFAAIDGQYSGQISAATTKFQQSGVMDPKAAVLPTYNGLSGTVSNPLVLPLDSDSPTEI